MNEHEIADSAAKLTHNTDVAERMTYAASGGVALAGLSWSEIATIIGIVIAFVTYLTTRHYAKKKATIDAELFRMAREKHELEQALLRKQLGGPAYFVAGPPLTGDSNNVNT